MLDDGEGFRLNIANATWGQKGYAFLDTYLDVLAVTDRGRSAILVYRIIYE